MNTQFNEQETLPEEVNNARQRRKRKRYFKIGVIIVLISIVLIIYVFLSLQKYDLLFKSHPLGAKMIISKPKIEEVTPFQHKFEEGEYNAQLSLSGFHPIDTTFEVTKNDTMEFVFNADIIVLNEFNSAMQMHIGDEIIEVKDKFDTTVNTKEDFSVGIMRNGIIDSLTLTLFSFDSSGEMILSDEEYWNYKVKKNTKPWVFEIVESREAIPTPVPVAQKEEREIRMEVSLRILDSKNQPVTDNINVFIDNEEIPYSTESGRLIFYARGVRGITESVLLASDRYKIIPPTIPLPPFGTIEEFERTDIRVKLKPWDQRIFIWAFREDVSSKSGQLIPMNGIEFLVKGKPFVEKKWFTNNNGLLEIMLNSVHSGDNINISPVHRSEDFQFIPDDTTLTITEPGDDYYKVLFKVQFITPVEEDISELVEIASNSFELGKQYYAQGQYKLAEAEFRKNDSRGDFDMYYKSIFYLGLINDQYGNLEEARIYYDEVTQLRPMWGIGWLNLSLCNYRLGRFQDALNNLEEADRNLYLVVDNLRSEVEHKISFYRGKIRADIVRSLVPSENRDLIMKKARDALNYIEEYLFKYKSDENHIYYISIAKEDSIYLQNLLKY